MSRVRTIRPDFWSSAQIMSCSPLARLLFIGIWNFCDDAGIIPASFLSLKAKVFPGDAYVENDIKQLVLELIHNDLLQEYSVQGKTYWKIPTWKNHQRIDKPTYRYPEPGGSSNNGIASLEQSPINRQSIDDNSQSALRIVDDSSNTKWNGKEEKENINICEAEASPFANGENSASTGVQEIFKYWQQTMNHPQAKLDSKRIDKIKSALKLGYTVDDLKRAIDGCKQTPFNMGKNERGEKYDDVALILRDAEHIDRFTQNASTIANKHTDDPFAGVL